MLPVLLVWPQVWRVLVFFQCRLSGPSLFQCPNLVVENYALKPSLIIPKRATATVPDTAC